MTVYTKRTDATYSIYGKTRSSPPLLVAPYKSFVTDKTADFINPSSYKFGRIKTFYGFPPSDGLKLRPILTLDYFSSTPGVDIDEFEFIDDIATGIQKDRQVKLIGPLFDYTGYIYQPDGALTPLIPDQIIDGVFVEDVYVVKFDLPVDDSALIGARVLESSSNKFVGMFIGTTNISGSIVALVYPAQSIIDNI